MAKVQRSDVVEAIQTAQNNPDDNTSLAQAVRKSLDWLAQENPGSAVELRVPPYRVVQLIEGVNHRRGTPPAVVEIDPKTWLELIGHKLNWALAMENGLIKASGEQSNLLGLLDSF